MNKISTSVHGIETIEFDEPFQLKSGGYAMHVLITDTDGQRFELSLFADSPERFAFKLNTDI